MASGNNSTLIKISKLISGFFNPLVSLIIFFIWERFGQQDFAGVLKEFLPALIIIVIPTSLWIFWNVKTGRYTNFDVSDRKQRHTLYYFVGVSLLAYIVVQKFLITGSWNKDFIFLLVLLVVMQASNFFIKSSMHTAFNIFVAGLLTVHNAEPWLPVFWVALSIIVGYTRVILKKHTVQEVLMGGFIGTLVSTAMIYFN